MPTTIKARSALSIFLFSYRLHVIILLVKNPFTFPGFDNVKNISCNHQELKAHQLNAGCAKFYFYMGCLPDQSLIEQSTQAGYRNYTYTPLESREQMKILKRYCDEKFKG
jgi:hypothetical protein